MDFSNTSLPDLSMENMPFGEMKRDKTFSIGLHIEKRVKESIEPNKNILLEGSWAWNGFMNTLTSGEVEDILLNIDKTQHSF